MAVDANFTSLFEKLKVEDPWLPPRTWESIPSQSGPPPLRRSRRTDSSASSVSEASLVRLTLNALQGVESALISIEKLSAAFCSDAADRTFHQIPSLWNRSSSTQALGKILESIGYSGFSVFLLRKFVDYFVNLNMNDGSSGGESGRKSLVNQAFAVALGKVLDGYICALDRLHASVKLRRSSKSVEVASGCLTSVVHSDFTFLEVYLHTKQLRTQIEALASICNLQQIAHCFAKSSYEELSNDAISTFCDFYRGADLLSYLYAKLKVADPAHSALLKYLFLRSCEPYCGFIRSWIFKAEISDPYMEFVVEYAGSLENDQNVKAGVSTDSPVASIKECNGAGIPCFLKDYLIPLVRAGQQLQVLMKLFELCKYVTLGNNSYMDFLPCWSGFSGNHPVYATPITFSKGNIEALVLTRKSYYERMQEKFEPLLDKLEFSYHEVPLHGTVPILFGNIGAGLNATDSFTVEDKLLVSPRRDQMNVAIGDDDSEDASTKSELSPLEDSESSECSSISSFEEQTELMELNKCSNILTGPNVNYFSGLKFSTSTTTQNKNPCHLESDLHGISEKTTAHGHFMGSKCDGTFMGRMSLPLESEEPNRSHSNHHHADSYLGRGWPLGSLLKNPFYVERNEIGTKLRSPDSGPKMSSGIANVPNDVLSYPSASIGSSDDLKLEKSVEHQVENGPTSDLFAFQPWKHNYDSNYLSKNPMLAKSSWLEASNSCGIPSQKPFPFFDFSSVSDPCKVFVEKITAGFTPEIIGNHNSSLTRGKSYQKSIDGYGGHSFMVGESETSSGHLPQELKKQNQEAATLTTVSGGSSWESLLNSSSISCSSNVGDQQQDPSIIFEMPLDFVIDKCLLQEILLQYNYVSRLTIKMLEEGFNLQEHLLALRRYHFMELGDWADLFILSLWNHKWCVTDAEKRISEIQRLLESSIQSSSCQQDHNKNRLFVYTKGHGMMPLSTSTVGVHSFDFLGLGYRVDWPVNIVLTPAALKIYADIFSFLIQLKLATFSLTDVWCSMKDMMHLRKKDSHSALDKHEVAKFNMLMKLRHQVNHFVSTLQQYVQSQLSHVSWCRFLHSFKHKVKDMMDLESVHMAYLTDSLHICFLSEETRSFAVIIENILQCALDFRSCLSGGMWDMRLGEGDTHDKLSQINISQGLAIKQKFDKNLKELHLCYLKSPKHGEFGVSPFWKYFNYNNYYSDANEVSRSAFSV